MSALDVVNAVAGIATAAGIGLGVDQVIRSRRQRRADFEQQFVDQYSRVIADVPLEMLLDGGTYDPSDRDARRAFYDYFELCEDEVFQAAQHPRRVSKAAWTEWRSGIASNMARPAFCAAWHDIGSVASKQFTELRSTDLLPPDPADAGPTLTSVDGD